jgi:hypothetical protein
LVTVDDIKYLQEFAGSQVALADELGVTPRAIRWWVGSGVIPNKVYQRAMLKLLEEARRGEPKE